MMSHRHLLGMFLLVVPSILVHESAAQSPSEPSSQALHDQLDSLIDKLEQMQIDWATADLTQITAFRDAVSKASGAHADSIASQYRGDKQYSALVQDYVTFVIATAPRLSGRIVRVGPTGVFADISAAVPNLQAGDCVLLEDGDHHLEVSNRTAALPSDIAFIGSGPERVTISGVIEAATRLRIEGAHIKCNDQPFVDLRRGGLLHLRICRVTHYNSGAGGSNGISANNAILLIERCHFDDREGRAQGRAFGDAFDLRGDCLLYVRQSQFIDNDEILRATFPCVFDGCLAITSDRRSSGVRPHSGPIVLHDSQSVVNAPGAAITTLALPTDHRGFVEHASDASRQIDDSSRGLAEALTLHRRIPYWIGLLRHHDPAIRSVAARHLESLVEIDVQLPDVGATDDTIEGLESRVTVEREFGRLMQWFETNASRLIWDQDAQRYQMREP